MSFKLDFQKFVHPKLVSRGAFGVVHRVKYPTIPNKLFAIKTMTSIDDNEKQKIKKEIKIWEKLSSLPHKPQSIPNYYGSNEESMGFSGFKYDLAFDFFPKTLSSLIKENKELKLLMPFFQLYNLYKSLINSLAFLQTMGICHRDLKPANLLLNDECQNIYLIDFSESKEIITDAPNETKKELTLAGSPLYFSPELHYVYKYEKPGKKVQLNPFKSDVFSLGLILLELGTLKIPEKNKDPEIWSQNISKQINKLKKNYKPSLKNSVEKKILKKLIKILKKCLEIEPDQRPDFKDLFLGFLKDDDDKFRKHILIEEQDIQSYLIEEKIKKQSPHKENKIEQISIFIEKKQENFKRILNEEIKIPESDILKQEKLFDMYNKKEREKKSEILEQEKLFQIYSDQKDRKSQSVIFQPPHYEQNFQPIAKKPVLKQKNQIVILEKAFGFIKNYFKLNLIFSIFR